MIQVDTKEPEKIHKLIKSNERKMLRGTVKVLTRLVILCAIILVIFYKI